MPDLVKEAITKAFMKTWGLWKDGGPMKLWYEGQLDGMIAYANEHAPDFAEELLERKHA